VFEEGLEWRAPLGAVAVVRAPLIVEGQELVEIRLQGLHRLLSLPASVRLNRSTIPFDSGELIRVVRCSICCTVQ